MRNNIKRNIASIILLAGLFQGKVQQAIATPPNDFQIPNGLLGSSWEPKMASINDAALNQYKEEWQYNSLGNTGIPPKLGLALSGGGMRSATFSIGVLHGLADIGVLTNVDLLSSVSGGGYAASWYYVQNLEHTIDFKTLFDTNGPYQGYLLKHGELVGHTAAATAPVRRFEYLFSDLPLTVCSWPVNLFANGLFGWHANVVPMRRIYEKGISREFQFVPREKGVFYWAYFTKYWDFFGLPNGSTAVEFSDLKQKIKGRLPFPIVNTSAHIEDAASFNVSALKNRVFEFTPLHYGSTYFGYYEMDYPLSYNRAISVSGAAVDSSFLEQTRPSTQRMLSSALDFDLGYFIGNPRIRWDWKRWITPFPIYPFLGNYQRDTNGFRIYLTDGGHSENLATYSLIRRLCRTIIVVDAGYDPQFSFDDYKLLKAALRSEMGVDFAVPDIDCGAFTKCNQRHPVMTGTVSYFPTSGDYGLPNELTLNVIYIKLSIDVAKFSNGYDSAVTDYFYRTRNHYEQGEISEFPQESTRDQSYTPEQFLAYHELGHFIVTNNSEIFNGLIKQP